MAEDFVSVRYIVSDVEQAIAFYTTHLGFTERMSALPAFADVVRGRLRLLLSGSASSGGRTLPDGRTPQPGGWNRIHLIVEDLPPRSSASAQPVSRSAATSSRAPGARRSCSTTRRATPSSSSSRRPERRRSAEVMSRAASGQAPGVTKLLQTRISR